MRRKSDRDASRATMHTAIIDSPVRMWDKLAWDVHMFHQIQRAMPDEQEGLAYSAINACIAAESLGHWTRKQWMSDGRAQRLNRQESEFFALLTNAVPDHRKCVAIANTSKHRDFSDEHWPGGSVSIEFNEGDEYSPAGLELHYQDATTSSLAYSVLDTVVSAWWSFLCELGYASGREPVPLWHEVHKWFADVPDDIAPG
jgi:hypothetical protein